MSNRTMYAVCPTECDISELVALFDDVTHAETYCEQINNDPDVGCVCAVAIIDLDTRGLVLREKQP